MDWNSDHIIHIGGHVEAPASPERERQKWRKRIEPWLSSVFQSEHLSLLLGSGFTSAVSLRAGGKPAGMDVAKFGCANEDKVLAHAKKNAMRMGRGMANIEDQLSAAFSLLSGLRILEHTDVTAWENAIDAVLKSFMQDILAGEKRIEDGFDSKSAVGGQTARETLVSFLMSFASRASSRERLHIFTTNSAAQGSRVDLRSDGHRSRNESPATAAERAGPLAPDQGHKTLRAAGFPRSGASRPPCRLHGRTGSA
jgi:hypothetical protein